MFSVLYGDKRTVAISGRRIREGANLIVDGRKVAGSISSGEGERVAVELEALPPVGMHFLQVQNPSGLFSNDFIFHVAENQEEASEIRHEANPDLLPDALAEAISKGDLEGRSRRAISPRPKG